MTFGPDPGELPSFWGSMVFCHAHIPWKGSGKQQQQPLYIHMQSNYAPVIKKQLLAMLSNRLSQLSCNQEEFAKAILEFEAVMRKSEYTGQP